MKKEICFVLMPFGQKPDSSGKLVDFDKVYETIIRPAIDDAGLDPIRADEESGGGIIHKPMFERLILSKFAVADLTTANPNVFYELGLRHAVRPGSTVLIFAEGDRLPFDVGPLRAIPYRLGPDREPTDIEPARAALSASLKAAREAARSSAKGAIDSPLYELVEDYPNVSHEKTDVFRDLVDYSKAVKKKLASARENGLEAVRGVERELGDLNQVESGVLVDLFLSYRATKGWGEMILLAGRLPAPLAATVLVQEQLALALNRAGRGTEAEHILLDLIEKRGTSSETMGILGRVYKDRWESARKAGNALVAEGLLEKAIDAYVSGFEADWRDAYPGINAVTLMEIAEPPDPRRLELLPVVTFAVRQKVRSGKPDYWDFATLLELAVLANDREASKQWIRKSLAAVRETWEPETTQRNLRLIRETREQRGEDVGWVAELETALASRSEELKPQ